MEFKNFSPALIDIELKIVELGIALKKVDLEHFICV